MKKLALLLGSAKGLVMSGCLIISLICFAQLGYIESKAYLAQILLNQAWQETQEQYLSQSKRQSNSNSDDMYLLSVKPWSWADVYPVAKLTINRLNLSYVVLNNDSGQALAFGPGFSGISGSFTNKQTQVISGHRDSHFEFLAELVIGDKLLLESASGQVKKFVINNLSVIDSRINQLYLSSMEENQPSELVLLTCYPFNSLSASTPFRLVVEAIEII